MGFIPPQGARLLGTWPRPQRRQHTKGSRSAGGGPGLLARLLQRASRGRSARAPRPRPAATAAPLGAPRVVWTRAPH